MKILVRLPNWLGDMVMSVGFIRALGSSFPGAEISVIAKKGIHSLLDHFPAMDQKFIFSKEEYKGLAGLYRFGKHIRREHRFDLFFCLPNSFSSAFMAFATGASKRIGYRNELREIFLTHAYTRPHNIHRAEEYIQLLSAFTGNDAGSPEVVLENMAPRQDYVVVNVNSEASSRRLTREKAVQLIAGLRNHLSNPIVLIGGPREQAFIEGIFQLLPNKKNIENVAGKTTLPELTKLIGQASVMLSTDSGPAHLSNALKTPTIVLFGAGDEKHTAPYNQQYRKIIRLGKLTCEPCEKNVCVRFDIPQCLEQLDDNQIINTVQQYIS